MATKRPSEKPQKTVQQLISDAEMKLGHYKKTYEGLSWREKVLLLIKLHEPISELGKYSNPELGRVGARERVRLYFLEHPGLVIDAKELEVVSGISEYARRIRELRVEEGYKIITGKGWPDDSPLKLKQDQYILLEKEPDRKAASRWCIVNRIRREEKGGSQGRILKYLKQFVGEVVTSEELYYVARASQFARRVRELRTEQGYAIATRFTGRPDLKMGEYVLESVDRMAEQHDRNIDHATQTEVYKRDKNSCRLCAWSHEKWSKKDPRILELHHIHDHVKGGKNTAENIMLLCSKCHDEVHAGRRKLPKNILE